MGFMMRLMCCWYYPYYMALCLLLMTMKFLLNQHYMSHYGYMSVEYPPMVLCLKHQGLLLLALNYMI